MSKHNRERRRQPRGGRLPAGLPALSEEDAWQVAQLLKWKQQHPGPCVLCTRPASCIGVWVPSADYQRKVLAPPGNTRVAVYALCTDCARTPAVNERVEQQLIADVIATLPPERN